MRKPLWIMLAVMVVAVSAPNAHADTVTLTVSGSLVPDSGGESCSASGCALSGTVVIDNTAGTVLSADLNISGESPTVGPFTLLAPIGACFVCAGIPDTTINTFDSSKLIVVELAIFTTTPGSLAGYDGGVFQAEVTEPPSTLVFGESIEGSLTPMVVPEPSSVALMLLGVGLVFVMRKRNSPGHQLAT